MVAAAPFLPSSVRDVVVDHYDRHVRIEGVSWRQYVTMSDALSARGAVKMTYLDGALEIMTTGSRHEQLKKTLARLLEAYADETRTEINGYGSTTFRKEAAARGIEPDECYTIGPLVDGAGPELAIEIVLSSGSIDKLAVYAGLEVPEVWFWEEGIISIFLLGHGGYARSHRSEFLPDVDVAELASFMTMENQSRAVWAYRERLRERASGPR